MNSLQQMNHDQLLDLFDYLYIEEEVPYDIIKERLPIVAEAWELELEKQAQEDWARQQEEDDANSTKG